MNPYENIEPGSENETIQAVPAAEEIPAAPQAQSFSEPQPSYADHRSGAKESPYANSPYTAYRQEASGSYSRPQYQPPYQGHTPAPEKSHRHSRPFWRTAVAALLTIALVAGGCLTTATVINNRWEARSQKAEAAFNQQIADLQKQINSAASKAAQAAAGTSSVAPGELMTPSQVYAQNVERVVGISCSIRSTAYGRTTEGTSNGSGFILTENGYVATNYHVIEGATEVKVITYGGESYPAKIVGHDSSNDVAVLKIEADGLPAVAIGSSEDLIIGDMVVAIGNPLGKLTATQTVGYVSGKNRQVNTDNSLINMIQTDAAINAGNSGGPLFNMKGEVVGITTAKYSGTTNSGVSIEGIGFAIPIDDVFTIIEDLQNLGYVTGAYLGVTVRNVNAESAAMFGLPTGAYVDSVAEGGSAEKAGIQPKDIIIQIGEYPVSNVTDLTRNLRHFKAGDTTVITLIRSGQQMEFSITLDEKHQNTETPTEETTAPNQQPSQQPNQGSMDDWYDLFRRFFGNIG